MLAGYTVPDVGYSSLQILDIALVVLLAALSRDQRLCEPLFRLSTSDVSLSDAHLNQSTSPSQSSTASPRKETIRNCELLETLVELSKRDWVKDEIGANQTKGKASKNDARHVRLSPPDSALDT